MSNEGKINGSTEGAAQDGRPSGGLTQLVGGDHSGVDYPAEDRAHPSGWGHPNSGRGDTKIAGGGLRARRTPDRAMILGSCQVAEEYEQGRGAWHEVG